jgi:hypothetical protein
LNVVREPEVITTVSHAVAGLRVEHTLEEIPHSFHYSENEEVVKGINSFVERQHIDMVAMIPQVHHGLKDIFKEPHTKQMAFHMKAPLLDLH